MGIDIYAEWVGQTKKEKKAQITGFSVEHSHIGYLREAYHGGPYTTRYLVQEAVGSPNHEARIPAKVLRERLTETIHLQRRAYGLRDEEYLRLHAPRDLKCSKNHPLTL